MTLKKAMLRGFLGIPIGAFISTTIGVIYSLVYGTLMFTRPVDGSTTALKAYVIQYVVSMIIGFVFAFGSSIFEVDKWSMAKQTTMHFFLTSIVFLPCSIVARWMEFNFISILIYILIFIIIYVLIWFGQYFKMKNKIMKMNKKLKER
jgi:DUF3021 family protein